MAINRSDVLDVFRKLPQGESITTQGIAWCLGCSEHRVRACVSWMVLGGVLKEVHEQHQRKDKEGRPYRVKRYQWTGKSEISRVPRDPTERALLRDQRNRREIAAFASKLW